MAQTPVKLGTFKDLMLDRQIEELVSYARSVAESTSGTAEAPTTISALTTAGGFGHVRLQYSYTSYNGHKYTEVWRSTDTTFANADRVGATAAQFYQDFPAAPSISDVFYYWVRNVNMDDVEGQLFGPVAGSVGSNPNYDLDLLLGQLGFWHLQPGTLPIRSEPIFPTLPSTLYPVNAQIYLTTNQKVYKNVNEAWVEDTSPGVTFKIIAGQIAAGALVVDDGVMQNGYIKNAHIADASIDNAKINSLDGGKITANSITASKYNELRNSLIFNGWDSLDDTHPFEAPFLLLDELTAIQSVKLSFKILPYRGYSTAALDGGGQTSNGGAGTYHMHKTVATKVTSSTNIFWNGDGKLYGTATTWTLAAEDGHTHTIPIYSGTGYDSQKVQIDMNGRMCITSLSTPGGIIYTSETNGHKHAIRIDQFEAGKMPYNSIAIVSGALRYIHPTDTWAAQHVTTMAAGNHTHQVSDHTHGIYYAIHEETNSPSITINIDDGEGYGTPIAYTSDQINVDITNRLTSSGWKMLKFTASARCRIAFVLECKLDITA